VPVNEFLFSTELSGPGQPSGLVRALVGHALAFTGGPEAVATALAELDQAVARAANDGRRSRLEVRSVGGRMEIVLSSDHGPVWRTSRPLA
jgi:hypothetical protein